METNTKRNKGPILLVLSVLSVLGAIFTLLPLELADDKCLFGYKAACPFVPFSTIILIAIAFYLNLVRKKQYISK